MKTNDKNKPTCEKELAREYTEIARGSQQLFARARRVFPAGSTRKTVSHPPYPLYIARGEGCRVYDVEGREYIDYANNYGPLILGHSNPRVMQAIRGQLENGTVLGGPTEAEILLAEKILASLPGGDKCLFCSSGTEAGMLGLRILRALSGRDLLLKCEGSYHGTSGFFTGGPGIPQDAAKTIVTVPFNDIDKFEQAVKKHKHRLAAVFMEPVMRGIPPRDNYLQAVREITREHDVFLVLDEVVTGFRLGRTSAQGRYGVRPDMTILGKLIGGGLPIGAVVMSDEAAQLFAMSPVSPLLNDQPRIAHGGTYNAHPLAMAAGLATLDELTDERYRHLEETGEAIREGIRACAEKAGVILQVVGAGSIFHVHFTDREIVDIDAARSAAPLLQNCFDVNLLIRGIYPAKSHYSFVSTPMAAAEIRQTLAAVEDTLQAMKPIIRETSPQLLA